jgi:hypothetical protein
MQVSPEALQHLIDALRRYQAKVDAEVSEVNRTVSARLQRLNESRDEAQREVRRRREDLLACDEDDDYGLVQSRLERAEDWLDRIDRRIGEVSDVLGYFKRSRAGVQESISRGIPQAVGYLEAKHKELLEFLSVALPGEHRAAAVAKRAALSSDSGMFPTVTAAEDVTALSLPAGFQWVRLDHISRSDDLRPEEKFSKVPEDEVENGFRLLKEEVLPALQVDPSRAADFFREYDAQKDRHDGSGSLSVFEAFFGDTHIRLTRKPGDLALGVTNGRHRIHLARKLGWTAIPARLV